MTAEEVYKEVYSKHYKFLSQNHMATDISKRRATIYAVQNTWRIYIRKTTGKLI